MILIIVLTKIKNINIENESLRKKSNTDKLLKYENLARLNK